MRQRLGNSIVINSDMVSSAAQYLANCSRPVNPLTAYSMRRLYILICNEYYRILILSSNFLILIGRYASIRKAEGPKNYETLILLALF